MVEGSLAGIAVVFPPGSCWCGSGHLRTCIRQRRRRRGVGWKQGLQHGSAALHFLSGAQQTRVQHRSQAD
eukprot:s126_g24.t1